jgi:ankyrin repeat protein
MVQLLIENIRVSPEPTDHQGKTPLHLAAESNNIEVVKYLIEQAKVNPTPRDKQLQTPLSLAKAKKCQKVVDYLEKPHPISCATM